MKKSGEFTSSGVVTPKKPAGIPNLTAESPKLPKLRAGEGRENGFVSWKQAVSNHLAHMPDLKTSIETAKVPNFAEMVLKEAILEKELKDQEFERYLTAVGGTPLTAKQRETLQQEAALKIQNQVEERRKLFEENRDIFTVNLFKNPGIYIDELRSRTT
jgi:hypothetical protein